MNLTWVTITDKGSAEERLHFRASAAIDLSYYAIFDSFYIGENGVSPYQHTCYWFGPKAVKPGENVVLYTRAGSPSTENRPDGSVFHFLFRGLASPLYTTPQSSPVLFELNTWAAKK
jgi:hypothetical protein